MLHVSGLPGPTHLFGGLSPGNVASMAHAGEASSPRQAALQVVAAAELVASLGLPVVLLPPLLRPDPLFLRRSAGHDEAWLRRVAYNGSFVWAANAATALTGTDGRTRALVANLAALVHRHMEAPGRQAQLQALLPGVDILDPLPSHPELGDEGAANHHRVQGPRGACDLFVWGREAGSVRHGHPARQTQEASHAVARRLRAQAPLFVRQHPAAIDAGAFHNDVVMVGEGDRILIHPQAWMDQHDVLSAVQHQCGPLRIHEVQEVSLADAVRSYLFNSLLLPTPHHGWVLVAPGQCQDGPAHRAVGRLRDEGFIDRVHLVDLDQSMRGGGGPACLRLRVPATPEAVAQGALMDVAGFAAIRQWITTSYRDHLTWDDLTDPALPAEVAATLAAWPLAGGNLLPDG